MALTPYVSLGTIILYLIPLPPYKKVKFCEKTGKNADQKKI